MSINKLILGDNLEILRGMESETIDLIYLDPPFFSNRNYEVIWGDAGEVRSFQDRWAGGMEHYIAWLKERVEQMHRILKPTGSIFLHCDWHADAYIRTEILDKIFGYKNFRNCICWKYSGWNKKLADSFEKRHDVIFFYAKKDNSKRFNGYSVRWIDESEYVKTRKQKVHIDENGRKYVLSDGGKGTRIKRFLDEAMKYGSPVDDIWIFDKVNNSSKERIGYPTQKPEALLQRIIECASNEGDTVLDPFVGGGTTIAVADRLKRNWIGIDQSVQAIKVTELRLDKQRDLFSEPFTVQLHKYDYDTLRYKNAFEFESWIVRQFGGTSNTKQRGDLGLDGKASDGAPVQVKRSDNIGRNVIDNFKSAIERYDEKLFAKNVAAGTPAGYIIAFSFGRGAVEEVARLKNQKKIIIKLVTVEEIVPIAKKPTLTVEITKSARTEKEVWEIEFTAKGASAAGIEFYSWDFDYNSEKGFKASVMLDKEGVQTHKFKAGQHAIAAKVVDNDGLESIEVIKLKVNGTVERE